MQSTYTIPTQLAFTIFLMERVKTLSIPLFQATSLHWWNPSWRWYTCCPGSTSE